MGDRLEIPCVVGLKYFAYGIPLPRDAVLGAIILKMETHIVRVLPIEYTPLDVFMLK